MPITAPGCDIVKRSVKKIGGVTGKTYGKIVAYITREKITDDTNIVHELFNVMEVKSVPDNDGKIIPFASSGDSGAL